MLNFFFFKLSVFDEYLYLHYISGQCNDSVFFFNSEVFMPVIFLLNTDSYKLKMK